MELPKQGTPHHLPLDEEYIMKKSIFTTTLILLAISAFSVSAQAEEAKRPNLSITSISEAQANAMGSQGVSKGSSVSTTVTIGNRTVSSNNKVIQLKVNNRAKLERHGANIIIQHLVTEHLVEKGDTLIKIAEKYGTTVESIMRLNKLKSTKILVGQRLKLV